MRVSKRLGLVATTLVVGVGLGLAAGGGATPATAPPREDAPPSSEERGHPVRVAVVLPSTATESRLAFGVVQASQRANLSFPFPGRLASCEVEVGDWVAAGDVLARLDATLLNHRVRAAQLQSEQLDTQAAQLGREAERASHLSERGATTEQLTERTVTALEAARIGERIADTQFAEARRLVRDATLRAPFGGEVVAVAGEPGEFVGAGMPIVTLAGEGAREVRTEVSAQLVVRLETGTIASVDIPMLGLSALPARVVSVTQGTPAYGHLFPVVLALDSTAPPVGSSADIRFEVPAAPGQLVPTAAVLSRLGSQTYVLRHEHGVVREVPVRVGEVIGGVARVVGSLAVGEEVVVGGHADLSDGDAVQVVR
jgi:RND family efflux transporter MFP subunit